MPSPPDPPVSARALLRHRDYLRYWAARVCSTLGVQIQSVTLGWQVYAVARETRSVAESAFFVGMIGLASFIPILLLALPAGEAADRYNRRTVLLICFAGEIVTAAVLTAAAAFDFATLPLLLAVAVAFGASRAFMYPATTALGPMLVPRDLLPRAIAWNNLGFQGAAIAGPAIGGALIAWSPAISYGVTTGLYAAAAASVSLIGLNAQPQVQAGSRWTLIKEGLAYVRANKLILGAISLDLFAVLLGGATALLPVFARDVLHVGPEGFGLLRAAPAIGAMIVGAYLAKVSVRRRAGPVMLVAVAVFGLMTVVFGLSRSLPLSVAALAIVGGADMLSVNIRHTLVQLVTPDAMRGRISAVSLVFIGASNELGEFETGVAARFLGPVGAAVFGGVGAIAVAGLWAKLFPELRKADRLQ